MSDFFFACLYLTPIYYTFIFGGATDKTEENRGKNREKNRSVKMQKKGLQFFLKKMQDMRSEAETWKRCI